jgi:mRNA interferase YafQ
MRRLIWDTSFRRAFKQRTRRQPLLQDRILDTLKMLAENPLDPSLKTHKLHGHLEGLWACWVEYDCRIVFTFESDPAGSEDLIVLADIGSHSEVY